MTRPRILYGLDRVPATIAAEDDRLPGVDLSPAPLRLNSVPLPAAAWDTGAGDHAARIAAVRSWLLAGCGDYNEALRRGITRYLDAVEAHVADHRDALAQGLKRFQGLYQVEDWCWSALRPLPRAWWRQHDAWTSADLAFWNGNDVIAMHARDFSTGELPGPLQRFWSGETLPVSPFRRTFPAAPDGITLRPSSP